MGRFRPPEKAGSKYITREGAQRLRAELEQLWREERPRVTQAVAAAAAQGDRSENAEYTYGKKRLREIDRRVRTPSSSSSSTQAPKNTPLGSLGGCSTMNSASRRPRGHVPS